MDNKKDLIKYGLCSIATIAAVYIAMKVKKKMTGSSDYRRHFDLDNGKNSFEDYSSKFIAENTKLQECYTFLITLAKLGGNKATKLELKNYSNGLSQSINEAIGELKEFCNLHSIDFTELFSKEFEAKIKDYDTLKDKDFNDFILSDYIAINKRIRDTLWKLNDESRSDILRKFYQKLIRKNDNQMEHIVEHIT